jgi:hypothetical protein
MLFTGFFEGAICYFMLFPGFFVVFWPGPFLNLQAGPFLGFTLIYLNWSWISLDFRRLRLVAPQQSEG